MKYKFFSATIVVLFCNAVHPTQIVSNIRNDINTEFGRPANADMMIITAERFPIDGGSSLISHNEFEQILRLLYGVCINTQSKLIEYLCGSNIPTYRRNGVALGKDKEISQRDKDQIEEIRRDISCINFCGNDVRKTSKLIIFSESFFSHSEPLNEEQKNFIENKLLTLSKSSNHSILYPNFLYTKVIKKRGKEVYADLLAMGKRAGEAGLNIVRGCVQKTIPNWGDGEQAENSNTEFIDAYVLKCCAENITLRVPNNEIVVDQEYIFNETCAICRGERVTKTTKAGYQSNCNLKIAQGCLYATDSGKTEAMPVNKRNASLQNTLLRDISVDLDPQFSPNLLKQINCRVIAKDSRLHIFQLYSSQPDMIISSFSSIDYLPYIDNSEKLEDLVDSENSDLMYSRNSFSKNISGNLIKFDFLRIYN